MDSVQDTKVAPPGGKKSWRNAVDRGKEKKIINKFKWDKAQREAMKLKVSE